MDRDELLDDPEEAQRLAMEGALSQVWTALPGIVEAVDLATQTVSVQPSIQGSVSSADGSVANVNLPLLVDVPICWPRAGDSQSPFQSRSATKCWLCSQRGA